MTSAPSPAVSFTLPVSASAVDIGAATTVAPVATAAPGAAPVRTGGTVDVAGSVLRSLAQRSITAAPAGTARHASSLSLFADLQSAITATNAQGSVNRALVERLLLAL